MNRVTISRGARSSAVGIGAILRTGIPLGPLRMLETTGRSSGRPRSTPIAVLNHDSRRWLVSPFGDTDWVKNVRTQPDATLTSGRHREDVTLQEVDHDTAAPVLKRYVQTFRRVPFVPPAFIVGPSSPVADFRREARKHPVFAIASRQPVLARNSVLFPTSGK